jgi:hypothetical protein
MPNILYLENQEKCMSNRAIFASVLLATAIGVTGLATLQSSSAIALSRFNVVDRDTKTEEKNDEKNPQAVGALQNNAIYEVRGSLGTQLGGGRVDLVDNYSFRIVKPGRYVFSLGGGAKPGSAELRLYTPTTLIANKKPTDPIDMVLQPGVYRLEAFRTPFAKGSFDYAFSMGTP